MDGDVAKPFCGVFPAGAGMNRYTELVEVYQGSVPRRRGDEPAIAHSAPASNLCSPQARG